MKTGLEIFYRWWHDAYSIRPESAYKNGTVGTVAVNEPHYRALIDLIDEAIREASQEGFDSRKRQKLMIADGDHGQYWKRFFLKGCLHIPGVAEAFGCKSDESIWRDQWQEVIRVAFKRPSLKLVAASELFDYLYLKGLDSESWQDFSVKHQLILNEIGEVSAVTASDGEFRAPWEA